jgi:hypothetical protein
MQPALCFAMPGGQEIALKPDELAKLTAYFRKTFANPTLQAKARPQKKDSCELYAGEDFVGVIFRDEEDGELSYNFSMAILDIDLE